MCLDIQWGTNDVTLLTNLAINSAFPLSALKITQGDTNRTYKMQMNLETFMMGDENLPNP